MIDGGSTVQTEPVSSREALALAGQGGGLNFQRTVEDFWRIKVRRSVDPNDLEVRYRIAGGDDRSGSAVHEDSDSQKFSVRLIPSQPRVMCEDSSYRIINGESTLMFNSGRRFPFSITATVALIALLSSAKVTFAQDDGREELDEGLALLGIFVGSNERDAVDVLVEDGKFYLPAKETFAAINTRLREEDNGKFLDTPIGSIEISSDALRDFEDATFVGEDFLIEVLSTPVSFDIEYYAVVLEPPWDPDDPLKSGDVGEAEVEPDVVPPIVGMTSVHGDVFTTYSDSTDEIGLSSQLEINGHAFGGVWRLRYAGNLDDHELTDYAWVREVTENIWAVIGRQQIGIHPLVDVVDMTGAQVAYSNHPETFEQIDDVGGILLDRGGGSGNGSYFVESPLLGQRRSEIEVRVFEALSDNQVESIDVTLTANNFLAPKGSFNIVAGAGVEGDLFQGDDDNAGEATGFARARYAPLDDVTLEAAASYTPEDGASGAIGAAGQLGNAGTAYVGVGITEEGSKSVEAFYYNEYKKADAESSDDVDELHDHFAELNYNYSRNLQFGVIARYNLDATYVLPFASWRPRDKLRLSARPNSEGDYRIEVRAEPFRDVTFQAFYEGDGFARVAYGFDTEFAGSTELSLEANYTESNDEVGVALGVQGQYLWSVPVAWRLRAERDESSTTGSLGLRTELRPGVSLYADGGIRRFESGGSETFGSLGLSFDVGFTSSGLAVAPRQATNPRLGRLAGQIKVPEGVEVSDDELEGSRIIVDGKPLGRVDTDGSYWLPHVPTGVRSVRLEADDLPIDLVIDSDTVNAKIAPGAVTPVDFELAIEVGAAGRVTGPDGEPVKGVPLQILNAEGEVVSRARSNQFGLFRLDGLRPGTYTLKALDIWEGASRTVDVGTEYVFGTDLKVDKPSIPEDIPETVTQP